VVRGAGTALNVATVLAGSGLGVLLGQRLPERTRSVVTDGLGLVTLLIAATSAASVVDPRLARVVGSSAPVLIVLGSVLLGGIVGSLLRIEARLEGLGDALRRALLRDDAGHGNAGGEAGGRAGAEGRAVRHARFVEGFVNASLVFCVGPLTVLGSLDDGLGRGIDKLALKATLDGFASIAFAASLGWGVAASAVAVLVVQGTLTALGAALGGFLPEAHLLALTATGGLLLAGVGLRLLQIRQVPVGDLLPALFVAPVLVEIVARAR
jgi:uncharacterized membrane protein YqgA involved in biofilm formation